MNFKSVILPENIKDSELGDTYPFPGYMWPINKKFAKYFGLECAVVAQEIQEQILDYYTDWENFEEQKKYGVASPNINESFSYALSPWDKSNHAAYGLIQINLGTIEKNTSLSLSKIKNYCSVLSENNILNLEIRKRPFRVHANFYEEESSDS